MSSQAFKPWLFLALIFLAGTGTGILLTVGLGSHFIHPPGAPVIKKHWMTRLTNKLDLTTDQQAKIEPIVDAATEKLQTLHRDEVDQAAQIIASVSTQISPLLTPDQKTKLEQMESEREKAFPGHNRPRKRPDGGPPGMGGHGGMGNTGDQNQAPIQPQ